MSEPTTEQRLAWENERHHYEIAKREDELARAEADVMALDDELTTLREQVATLRAAAQAGLSRLDHLEKHGIATIWDADAATTIRAALAATTEQPK